MRGSALPVLPSERDGGGWLIPLMVYPRKSHFLPFLPALLAMHQIAKALSPAGLMLEG